MKAIITKPGSIYNGLTFPVKELRIHKVNPEAVLEIKSLKLAFNLNEVWIVDFEQEIRQNYKEFLENGTSKLLTLLYSYSVQKKINFSIK